MIKRTVQRPMGRRASHILSGLLVLIPATAHASNECQIKYAYAPSPGQSSTVTVNLDAGETKDINRSNVLYVQNVKNYKVRVYRSGFGSFVELAQNNRDPGIGNYMGNVILQKVTCVNASSGSNNSGPAFQTPAAMISALKSANTSVISIATQVAAAFNVNAQQMAALLRSAGYDATLVGQALKAVFNLGAQQTLQALKLAGFSIAEVATALRTAHNQSVEQAIQLLRNAYNVHNDVLRQSLLTAGYSAIQVAESLTPPTVVLQIMVLNTSFRASSTSPPVVPIYLTNNWLTYYVIGESLETIREVTGLPPGAQYALRSVQNQRLDLHILMPSGAPAGRRGTATLVGQGSQMARFHWTTTQLPAQAGDPRPATGGTATTTAVPDLVPATIVNNLYKVGTATTMDVGGATYTALNPFNNSPFCQGIPEGATGRDNMPTSNRRDITVPNIRWGVQNTSSVDATTPFNVKLYHGSAVVATQRVTSLPRGQTLTFEYARPRSTTTVARVGPGSGCFHVGLSTQGWNDNAGYQVRVDTENEVSESNNANNSRNMN